jgi:hypothetical protein
VIEVREELNKEEIQNSEIYDEKCIKQCRCACAGNIIN